MTTYYCYRITAEDSEKYYIGVSHVPSADASEETCLRDGYWGSGGKKFRNWRNRHRDSLKKEILGRYVSKEDAYRAERDFVGDLYLSDPNCLNSVRGGVTVSLDVKSYFAPSHCEIHGETLHMNGSCLRCRTLGTETIENCPIHGDSIHQGGVCRKCASSKMHQQNICEIHGETTFRGAYCLRCVNGGGMEELECSKHGFTIHHKGKCRRCHSEGAIIERECPIHGLVKHQGEHCLRCKRAQEYSMMECSTHGEVKHRNGKCQKCAAAEQKARRAMKGNGSDQT